MSQTQRVFVTGIGVVSPVGIGKERFWTALLRGKDGIAPFDALNEEKSTAKKAGYVRDFDPKLLLKGYNYRRLSRYGRFITAAAELAIEDSHSDLDKVDAVRKGLIFNTIHGAFEDSVAYIQKLATLGPGGVSPLKFAQTVDNAPATHLSIKYQLKGVSTVVEGASAIALAYNYLRSDQADLVLCGGADVIASVDQIVALSQAGMLAHALNGTPEASRPGDIRRNGFVYGEAAAFVLLETESSVHARNAEVYCEIAGYGNAHDRQAVKLFHQRRAEPIAYAVQAALQDAGVTPAQVQYINSLANSSHSLDQSEAQAIKQVFPAYAAIPVSTCKGSTGETFGASDALGIIQAALTLKQQTVAPIAGGTEIDPECGLQYIYEQQQHHEIDIALSMSCEVGGNVQAMVLQRRP